MTRTKQCHSITEYRNAEMCFLEVSRSPRWSSGETGRPTGREAALCQQAETATSRKRISAGKLSNGIIFSLSLLPLLAAAPVFAVDAVLSNSVPDLASAQSTGSASGDFIGWVQSFYQFSLIAAVFLAVGVIVWAGLRYALAAGNPSTQSDARDQILQALLGLILLFGAYLILYTINPNLVKLNLPTLESVNVQEAKSNAVEGPNQPTQQTTNSPGGDDGSQP